MQEQNRTIRLVISIIEKNNIKNERKVIQEGEILKRKDYKKTSPANDQVKRGGKVRLISQIRQGRSPSVPNEEMQGNTAA